MVDIVISVVAKVAEYLVAPVGRQLGYLFCYNSNLAELQDQVEKLDDKRRRLHRSVNEAETQGNGIEDDVQKWLKRADGISQEVEKFIEDEKNAKKRCCKGLCPNLVSRYKLSRQAKKKALDVKKSQEGGNFETISYPLPPPGAGSAALPGGYEAFESRNPELEKIMESLRCDVVKMIGVWGMGGVGKTTLVKQVARLAKQENLFATEIYIDVSWTRDPDSKNLEEGIAKIQQHIADMLGFKFKGKGETTRAAELMKRLQQKEKEPEKEKELKKGKILIILDDIWKEINLEKVGIPSKDDQTICKVVSVSRNEHLLSKGMSTEICFRIRHLQEKEDWRLFTKTVGDSVEGNNELRSIAIEVVKECGGLPIAIVTVANALKGESVDVWKNALHELRTSAPTSIYGVEENVYACLELSYNRLKDDKVKSLFLLCGCLSYYGDISMDVLLARAMGLDFFDDTELLEQARRKLVALVRTLKASSLLLDGEDDGDASRVGTSRLLFMDAEDNKYVRMHDLVRDVARNIASKDSHRFVVREDVPLERWSETDESKFISLHCKVVHELPHRLVCPKLQFFLLQSNSHSLNVPDNFFEGMNQLKVLALSGMHFTTIPSTLQSLANLRTLCLERCKLEDIVIITELKKLQVLSLMGSSIQQLPPEMARLTNLRLLDLHDCLELKVIPRNILSKLSGLECLFMKSSFSQWAAKENNDGESNACLSELNHLHHLTTIDVEIPNVKLVPEEDKFFQNLTSYVIIIGDWPTKIYERSKTLRLQAGDGSLLFRNGMGKLLEKIEELELWGRKDNIIYNNEKNDITRSLFSPSMPMSFRNLKYLSISDYENVFIPIEDEVLFGEKVSIPNLEELRLNILPKLKKIWHHNLSLDSFSNLRNLRVTDCPCLLNLIPSHSSFKFKNLKKIVVERCKALEYAFDLSGYDTNNEILQNLETLQLENQGELKNEKNESTRDCHGKEDKDQTNVNTPIESGLHSHERVSLPNLEEVTLDDLPQLKKIWDHILSPHSFSNLRILTVEDCPCLLNVIPAHLMGSLNNLKEMKVTECEALEHVFDFQGYDDTNDEILPKLETLELEGLVELKGIVPNNDSTRGCFSPWMPMSFHNLKYFSIENCGKEDKYQGNADILIQDGVLFGEKVSFPTLVEVTLYRLPQLKKIWDHTLSPHSFSNLRILTMEDCPCLLNVIPAHLMGSLNNLKEMIVRECEALEHVFDIQGYDDTNDEILPKLETLKLEKLLGLKGIVANNDITRGCFSLWMPLSFHNLKCLSIKKCGKEDKHQGNADFLIQDGVLFGEKVSLPNLEEVTLFGLPKLKKIWDHTLSPHSFSNLRILTMEDCPCLLNVIPAHLMGSLNNLKEMIVRKCEALEHVFDIQGYDDTNDEILPKLETLKLEKLLGLKVIVANNDITRGCFSPWMPLSFHNLKCLSIKNCGKEDKDQGNANILIQDGVFFGEKVSFPNLEKLNLSGLSMLKMIWHPQQYEFSNKLQILSVCTCPHLVSLIPSHLLQRFQNLKKVVVRDCEVLNYVFDGEGILPKVEILKLEELPKLKLIFNDGDKNDNTRYLLSLSKFKVLEHIKKLHIVNCGKSMDEEGSFSSNLEVLALGSFSKLKEINFENHRKLKILKLEKLPKLSHIILNEDGNASKRCLLSPSTFKNFDGLKELCIIDCGMEERRDVYTPTNGIVLSNEKVPLFDGAVCNYEAFKSRASIFDKIMDALRDDNINSIGVVGIEGVGKTTLIKQVAHQAMQRHLFTKQLYLDLSRTHHTDKLRKDEIVKIQKKIIEMLGWEYEKWYWYRSKAVNLKKRLKQEKMLIILDDIWKEINLEEIGIPSCKDDDDDVNECKIVLTSRSDGGMLSKDMMMGAQTCFVVETLPPDEALTLFEKTVVAGANSVVEENITELIKECEGVPLAIVTIAKALKDETMDVWKNALQHLKNCATMEGKKVVYSCLEWSYTHLNGDHDVKSLLLLCAMLGYDDISMDHLLKYAIGLDLFGPINSLDQARNRLLELVEILKASSWLIELDHRPKFVRMHDVVYDVVREIASKDPHPFVFREDVIGLEEWSKSDESKRCAFLSLHYKVVPELPQQLVCPELQCFLLRNNKPSLNISIPNTFFQGMKKLQVLDLSYMGFTTLPSSLDSLENLQTLLLDWCHKLEDIALIGKLMKLQVLSLVGSTIRKLPDEMEQLTNLRLLDLNDCKELAVIPHNVLSILSRLESLCIRLLDAKLLPKDIQFENLTRYAISIGFWWGSRKTHRTLTLNKVNISLDLGDGIHKLLERSEELEFKELSGTNYVLQYPLGGESFVKLKHLKVSESPEIEYIIDSKDQRVLKHGAAFPLLESLVLSWMENLQEVWHGHPIPRGSFGNLKTLKVEYCYKLRYLFSFSTARGLSQLQNMTIRRCEAMKQIITYERKLEDEYDEGGTNLELFPNLQTLKLQYLPKLINFIPELKTNARLEESSFNHKVSFSKLEKLELLEVPKLKDVWNLQRPFGSFSNVRILK